jgi:hypothetical protein
LAGELLACAEPALHQEFGPAIMALSESGSITMPELTLESLARRLEEVERRLNERESSLISPAKDWRSVIGISEDNEFTRLMLAEIEAAHEADRQAALAEDAS